MTYIGFLNANATFLLLFSSILFIVTTQQMLHHMNVSQHEEYFTTIVGTSHAPLGTQKNLQSGKYSLNPGKHSLCGRVS